MARIRVDGFNRFGFVNDASPEDLPPAAFSYVRNARFSHLGVDTFEGESSIFSTPTVTPLWYKFFPPPATPLLVYGNLTKMYAYDGTTHTEITRVASNYAGNAAERWQGEVFQGVGIFNNVLDVPQHWSSFATGTKLIDLANWPANYKCRTLRPFKNFLFAMHPYESGVAKPYRVRWSHPAAPGTIPTSWDISDATKDAREVDLATTPGIIHDGLELGDQFIVYKEDSAYAFSYIGPPFIFRTVDFPVEVRTDFELYCATGDNLAADQTADNVTNVPIWLRISDGTIFNLGTKNKCISSSETGGNAGVGGGSRSVTYSYVNFSNMTITAPHDPSGL
jgi:hypothetical protein